MGIFYNSKKGIYYFKKTCEEFKKNSIYFAKQNVFEKGDNWRILNSFDDDDTRKKQISRERNWLKFDFHFQRNERKRK